MTVSGLDCSVKTLENAASPHSNASAPSNNAATTRRVGWSHRAANRPLSAGDLKCTEEMYAGTGGCGRAAKTIQYLNIYSGDQETTMPASTSQSRRITPSGLKKNRVSLRSEALAAQHDRADLCEVRVVNLKKVDRARRALPDPATLVGLAETLRALGDPTRLLIVSALATHGVDELCVCDLATLVGVSDSAVSHSLRTLRQLGLVRYRKVGKIAYYTLDDTHVGGLVREGIRHIER